MPQATMTYKKTYPEPIVKAMEAIVTMPSGRKRWRAIASAWVNINQIQEDGLTAKQAYLATVDRATDKREHLYDKFAELKSTETARDSGVREVFEMPAGLWQWIKMFDMEAFAQGNPQIKRNMRLLREEFPEFCVTNKDNI